MPGAANSSSASASGGGSVLARAWNYVFGLVEEDEGYGSEGEDGLVGPIGGREEGEDTDPNEWVPAQWGPYARAAGPPLGDASGGGGEGEASGSEDGTGSAARVVAGGGGAALPAQAAPPAAGLPAAQGASDDGAAPDPARGRREPASPRLVGAAAVARRTSPRRTAVPTAHAI